MGTRIQINGERMSTQRISGEVCSNYDQEIIEKWLKDEFDTNDYDEDWEDILGSEWEDEEWYDSYSMNYDILGTEEVDEDDDCPCDSEIGSWYEKNSININEVFKTSSSNGVDISVVTKFIEENKDNWDKILKCSYVTDLEDNQREVWDKLQKLINPLTEEV